MAERTRKQDHPSCRESFDPPKSQLHPKTGSQKAGWDWLKQELLGVGNEVNQVG